MAKKTNFADVFKVDETELQPKPVNPEVSEDRTEVPVSDKQRHIGAYFSENVYKQMKHLGAETGMTTKDILTAGLNAVFRMHDNTKLTIFIFFFWALGAFTKRAYRE